MSDIEKVDKYLTDSKVFYLATVDGNQPKVKLGFHRLYDEKIYFGIGDFKAVYKQIVANPKIEIATTSVEGDGFLRYYGEAKFEEILKFKKKLLKQYQC